MNDLLELKGRLDSSPNISKPNPQLPSKKILTKTQLENMLNDLINLDIYWNKQNIISGALISVYYNRVIPKSSRIKVFMSQRSENSNDYIRGVRFGDNNKKHIITYYISKNTLKKCIKVMQLLVDILDNEFNGSIDNEKLKLVSKNSRFLKKYNLSMSSFKNNLIDLVDIERFDVYKNTDNIDNEKSFITLFNTEININDLMNKLGINNTEFDVFSDDTIYISNPAVLMKIRESAPYIVSMAMTDLATYKFKTENKIDPTVDFSDMPNPKSEPVVGVIDTLFSDNVYFSKWVEYHDCLSKDLERSQKDYVHGTEVTSLIVDGGRINPKWDDGCGFFRVRHFGVAQDGVNSSFDIINKIRRIVEENKDIHVWNISLGSKLEINDNYISPEASALDEIQYKNNVIFVVAGTNKTNDENVVKIGAPADSINSLVVNAIDKNNKRASYARKGRVLSFFVKPDVCAFGGDDNEYINVCSPMGEDFKKGTSFAAPWITRKLAFLIDKMGLSREIAKALIISSAVNWNSKNSDEEYMGYGVVPTQISDVMLGKKDEIKFYIEGIANSYYTYSYNLPVPMVNDKFPFYGKAVMCYFPKCSRSQGVDYTNTELDLQFGRMGKIGIRSINKNTQGGEYEKATNEATARDLFRKWDNVKVVIEEPKERKIPKIGNGTNLWGVKITNKERLERDRGLKFGVVVTLQEMDGKNRNREFIDQCQMRNWIVNRINIDNRLEVQLEANEIIKFE